MTQTVTPISLPSLFNPGLQDDDSLVAGFVARQDLLDFFVSELRAVPMQGTVQHHLVIGARGMGKTTLLKRLAIAIRQDCELSSLLIPLTFPEEQYNVKDLADLWLNAMDALGDELERSGRKDEAHDLDDAIARLEGEGLARDTLARRARTLLVERCAAIGRRPVLLVDNIDIVFARVDKSGRKVKNPGSGAYWELREALSRSDSPLLIGGSVRLSEPMVTYEMAFYDFFAVHRLDKLNFDEMRAVLAHLSERHGIPRVRQMLVGETARLRTLHDLTGGNVRTVLFLFHLLAQGVESDVREDLERLLDMVTPLYKARFEELAEQSQVVLHALAMRWNPSAAREVAADAQLATGLVSAQLETLQRDGMVDKVRLGGSRKMGYQVSERFFNLWLLMRTSRRMRQKLAYLTKFLESFYDAGERRDLAQRLLGDDSCGRERSRAELAWALADSMEGCEESRALKAKAGSLLLDYCSAMNLRIAEIVGSGDLPEHQMTLLECRQAVRNNADKILEVGVDPKEFELVIMGSIVTSLIKKQQIAHLLEEKFSSENLKELVEALNVEEVLLDGLNISPAELNALRVTVADGLVNLNALTLNDVKAAAKHYQMPALLSVFWTLLFASDSEVICVAEDDEAVKLIDWGWSETLAGQLPARDADEWKIFSLRYEKLGYFKTAVSACRKAIELAPSNDWLWWNLGRVSMEMGNHKGAEEAYRKGIELNPTNGWMWHSLGGLLEHMGRYEETEQAYRKGIEVDQSIGWLWDALGVLLENHFGRYEEAEQAFRKSIELDPSSCWFWYDLGNLLKDHFSRYEEAELAYRKGIELDPSNEWLWVDLGNLLQDNSKRYEEAEQSYTNALKIQTSMLEPRTGLVILALRLGETQKALNFLEEMRGEGNENLTVCDTLNILIELRQDNWGAASETFRKVFASFGQTIPPAFWNNILQIFAWAIACKHGEKMLALLDEMGARERFWPLVAGFEAALAGDVELLLNTASEARGAAQRIFESISHQCEGLLIKQS